jgi:hypothetical protein
MQRWPLEGMTDGAPPRADLQVGLGKVRNGARGRVPAAKAERPLSVQSRDLRGDAGQRARRADSGHLPERGELLPGDPFPPFAVRGGGGIRVAHCADPARAGRYLPVA